MLFNEEKNATNPDFGVELPVDSDLGLDESEESPRPGETKRQAFERISVDRVNLVVDRLRILSQMSQANYKYTEDDVKLMFDYIREAVDKAEARMLPDRGKLMDGFKWR